MKISFNYGLLFCSLLALHFGTYPIVARHFQGSQVSIISIILATEVFKFLMGVVSMFFETKEERELNFSRWSIADSLKSAALPAVLFSIQNFLVQNAYLRLDAMTFNIVNQTKVRIIVNFSHFLLIPFSTWLSYLHFYI